MTVGPWKPIYLETYQLRISDVDIRTKVSEKLDAKVDVHITLSAARPAVASVKIKAPDGTLVIGQESMKITDPHVVAQFTLSAGAFELWYPVGYGKQPIYTAEIIIATEVSHFVLSLRLYSHYSSGLQQGNVLDRKIEKFAFRRALVVQDELIDQEGRTFLFEINNIRVFCGGA